MVAQASRNETRPLSTSKGHVAQPATRFTFTKASLKRLAPSDATARRFYHDSKARGLCALISAKTITFYVLRKVRGRTERVLLGRFPETTIEQARKRAGKVN